VVRFPDRHAFLAVVASSARLRDQLLSTVQFAARDPSTGCPTHTGSFDFPNRMPRQSGNAIVPGAPVADIACHYVDDWLENTAEQGAAATQLLAHALDQAPPPLPDQSPDDTGCSDPRHQPDVGDSVLALFFRYPHAGIRLVTAWLDPCNRLASYVSDGPRTRAMTGLILRRVPALWTSYPDPDTMP
jgi:hypothetical protein